MKHPVDQHVGRRLKRARNLRRLSQTELAGKASVSFQQIQKYETCANRISASRLFEFAQILDVHPAYFFEGLDQNGNPVSEHDANLDIIKSVSAIDDERVKEQILNLIEGLSGLQEMRKP